MDGIGVGGWTGAVDAEELDDHFVADGFGGGLLIVFHGCWGFGWLDMCVGM